MSWWSFAGDPPDERYAGDEPADAVGWALDELGGQTLSSLSQLGAAIEAELRAAPEYVVDLVTLNDQRIGVRGEPPTSPSEPARRVARTAILGIADAMRERFGRPPHVSEIIYAFNFVLRPSLEQYVAGATGNGPLLELIQR